MTATCIYDAVRTPFGRAGGALAGIRPDDLAATVMRATVERTGLDAAR
ncbi:MAG: 3-oxoadipyl-CoA thiolase, partial [Actinomycetota bacterium]